MRLKICLWAILFSFLPVILYAQSQNSSPVLELYVKSGMEKQLGQLSAVIQAYLSQTIPGDDQAQKLPKEVLSALSASAQQAFAPEMLKKVVLAELTGKLTDRDIKEVLLWLDSPLGKRCTQLEEAGSTSKALAVMQQYAAGLKNSPPTAERMKLLREFDSAVKCTETAVAVAIKTQIAVAVAVNATFPVEQQKPLDDIAREIEKTRPAVEASVRSHMLISCLYTYRSLTDAEIRLYTAFARTPAGSRYHLVGMTAFEKAIFAGATKWGQSIGDIIKGVKSNSEA